MRTKTFFDITQFALHYLKRNLDDHSLFFLFGEDWTEEEACRVGEQINELLDKAKVTHTIEVYGAPIKSDDRFSKIAAIRHLRKVYGLDLWPAKVLFESYCMHAYGRESGDVNNDDLTRMSLWIEAFRMKLNIYDPLILNASIRAMFPIRNRPLIQQIDWDAALEYFAGQAVSEDEDGR